MGGFSREGLPAADRYIDKQGIDFDAVANPSGRLRRNQRGAAAEKWFVNGLPRVAVVEHWPAHALDRLLGRMLGFRILPARRDSQKRGLFAVAGPVTFLAYGIPAGFVLPVIIAPAHDQALLGPNDLRPNRKAGLV